MCTGSLNEKESEGSEIWKIQDQVMKDNKGKKMIGTWKVKEKSIREGG